MLGYCKSIEFWTQSGGCFSVYGMVTAVLLVPGTAGMAISTSLKTIISLKAVTAALLLAAILLHIAPSRKKLLTAYSTCLEAADDDECFKLPTATAHQM